MARTTVKQPLGLPDFIYDPALPKADGEYNVPAHLVEYLQRTFSFPTPTVDVLERQLWINVGKAQVVEHFLRLHERQYKPKDQTNVPTQPEGTAPRSFR